MPELELIKSLLQMGAAGVLIIAGNQMLIFLREERADRAKERSIWFEQTHEQTLQTHELGLQIKAAIDEMRASNSARCPMTGLDTRTIQQLQQQYHTANDPKGFNP